MKPTSILILMLILFSCKQQTDNRKILLNRIDSLETKLANTYKPGFGEFMGSVQYHHAKLWFAGQNKNWKLAAFEIHELEETLEDITTYQTEREESKFIKMIIPDIDSISNAIQQKNLDSFTKSYSNLTKTCNNCHQLNKHAYIIAKIPHTPSPYTNQDFKTIK